MSNYRDSGGSPQRVRLGLRAARILSVVMYAGSLGTYIVVGSVLNRPAMTEIPAFFPWIMMGVAVIDYALSLVLEGMLLSGRARHKPVQGIGAQAAESQAASAAIVISSFGVSMAVFGVILALMSFTTWAWYLYALSAIHGIHLQLRWDRYEEAVQRARAYPG